MKKAEEEEKIVYNRMQQRMKLRERYNLHRKDALYNAIKERKNC